MKEFTKTIAREVAVSSAISAGSTLGLIAMLTVIGSIIKHFDKKN